MRKFIRFEISYGQVDEAGAAQREGGPDRAALGGTGLMAALLRFLLRTVSGSGGASVLPG